MNSKISNSVGDVVSMGWDDRVRNVCLTTKDGQVYRIWIGNGFIQVFAAKIGNLLTAKSLSDDTVELTVQEAK